MLLECQQVRFSRATTQWVIDKFSLRAGEKVFIQGPSGSGKTTLLNLVSGLIKPDEGSIALLSHELTQLSQAKCDKLRGDHLGFIFQQFNLVPYLSVLDNVLLPAKFSAVRKQRAVASHGCATEQAKQLLKHLGMADYLTQPVSQLSVGQQQRVAAARAFLGQPELVLADEPTSALDRANQAAFIDMLFELAAEHNTALLFVSHDDTLIQHFDKVVNVCDWQIKVAA